jgi:hypothetical protein
MRTPERQEAFVEAKIVDLSRNFDFLSARAGIQPFTSDFRGFLFSDQEPGLRLFGTLDANRYQFNAAHFVMLEKDSNSGLNSMAYRSQQVLIGNLYRQDFLKPGYNLQVSFHYDKDDATLHYDTNDFLVRPAAVGLARPHKVRSYYYGLTGDGHIGRLNLTHAFYQALGPIRKIRLREGLPTAMRKWRQRSFPGIATGYGFGGQSFGPRATITLVTGRLGASMPSLITRISRVVSSASGIGRASG